MCTANAVFPLLDFVMNPLICGHSLDVSLVLKRKKEYLSLDRVFLFCVTSVTENVGQSVWFTKLQRLL